MSLVADESSYSSYKDHQGLKVLSYLKSGNMLNDAEESVKFLEEMCVKYWDRLNPTLKGDHALLDCIRRLPNKYRAIAEMSQGFEETFAKLEIIRKQMEMITQRQTQILKVARAQNSEIDSLPHLVELNKLFEKALQYTAKAKETSKKIKGTADKVEKLKKKVEKIHGTYKKKMEKK